MKTLLKFGLASLSLATLGITSTLPVAPLFGSTIVSANDATSADSAVATNDAAATADAATGNTSANSADATTDLNTATANNGVTDTTNTTADTLAPYPARVEYTVVLVNDPNEPHEFDEDHSIFGTLNAPGDSMEIVRPEIPGYTPDPMFDYLWPNNRQTVTYTREDYDYWSSDGSPAEYIGSIYYYKNDTHREMLEEARRPRKLIKYSFILEGYNDTANPEVPIYISEGNTITFPGWDPSRYELIEGEITLNYDRVTEGGVYTLKVRRKQQTTDQQPPQADKKIIVGLANVDEGNGWADEVTLKPGETWTFDMSRLTNNGREYVSGPLSLNYDDVTNGHVYNVYFREVVKPAPDKPQATKTIYVGRDYDGRGGGRLITLKPGESYVLHDDSKPSGGWKYVSGSKVVTYDEVVDGGRYVVYYTQDETPAPDKDTPKPDTNQPDSTKPDANKPNPGTPVGYLPGKEKDSFIQPVTKTPPSTTPQTGVTGTIGSQKPAASSADKAKPTTNGSASATQAPSGEQVAPTASNPAPTSTSSTASATTSTQTLPKTGDASSLTLVATGASLVMASLGLAADRRKKA